MLKAAKAYLATQVSTSSQGDLLLMLYDTAVKHLHLAIEKMRAGDVAAKGILITKAINIISELQESLNKERGGDISKNLFNLYFFCNTRLLKANLQMNTEMVEEVITIISGLRQAFAQIMPSADGVASIVQQGVTSEVSAAPAVAEQAAPEAPAEAAAVSPEEAAPEAAPAGPVNPVRFRAANAYATSR
jgi:flagellar secretion chaperone FliS